MVLVFSTEPTKVTYVDDKVTRHLFDHLYEMEKSKGGIITIPEDVLN